MSRKIFRQPQFFQISIVSIIMLLAILFAQSIRAEFMRQTGPERFGYGYGYGRGKGFGSIYQMTTKTSCYGYGYNAGCGTITYPEYYYGTGYRITGGDLSQYGFGYGYGLRMPGYFDASNDQFDTSLFSTSQLEAAGIVTPSKPNNDTYQYVFNSQVQVRISDPKPGDLIKSDIIDTVYYFGSDGRRYPFPDVAVFRSWGGEMADVRVISQNKLETYPLGQNITMRSGSLIKLTTWPVVFVVVKGDLVSIPSEEVAHSLYGGDWAKQVIDLPDLYFVNYTISGKTVNNGTYPVGSLVRFASSTDVYYISAEGQARKFANDYAFRVNRFDAGKIIDSDLVRPETGTDIIDTELPLIDPTDGRGGVLRLAPTPEARLVIPKDLVYTANEQSLSFEKITVSAEPDQAGVSMLWRAFGSLSILTASAPEIDRPIKLAIHFGSALNGQNVNFYFKKLGLNFERSCVVAQGVCEFSSPYIFDLEVKVATSKPLAAISSDATSTVATTSAVVSVNQGFISAYRYSLDGGAWSPAMPASEDLKLNGLTEGSHQLRVIGRDGFGNWQDSASPTVKDWTIVLPPPPPPPPPQPPVDNNQGGNSGGSGGTSGGGAILAYPLTTVANTTRPLAAAVEEQSAKPRSDAPKAQSGAVLGVKITTDSWQELRDGAAAIVKSGHDLQSFLDYNQTKKDVGAQKNGMDRYLPKLTSGLSALTQSEKYAINNFIVYGTPSTADLGANERSYAVESHKTAYGRLPKSEADWLDCLAIAVGRVPNLKNSAAEAKASIEFKKIYKRPAADGTKADLNAINLIAYGLRPVRNQAAEERAAATFRAVYRHAPKTNWDWQLVRAIAYSGAKR